MIISGLFEDRLSDYILLNFPVFEDTDTPVCLALFKKNSSDNFKIWELNDENNIKFIGNYKTIKNNIDKILKIKKHRIIKFNDSKGKFGVLATDKSTKTIKFINGKKIPENKIKSTSRNIVRFSINDDLKIDLLNKKLKNFFKSNGEIFLVPFKNLRKDGKYRRRLDFSTIKRMVQSC